MAVAKKDLILRLKVENEAGPAFEKSKVQAQGFEDAVASIAKSVEKLAATLGKYAEQNKQTFAVATAAAKNVGAANEVIADSYKQVSEQLSVSAQGMTRAGDAMEELNAHTTGMSNTLKLLIGVVGGFAIGNFLTKIKGFNEALPIVQRNLEATKKSTTNLFFGTLKAAEGAALLAPILYQVGTALKETDSEILQVIGNMVRLAGIVASVFAGGVALAAYAVGNLALSLGEKLLNSMVKFEQIASKAEQSTAAFTFTVVNFGKQLGEQAVGSLQFWNTQVDDLVKTTTYSANAVQKSVKLLVAEGTALGNTVEQNADLLKRSGDIAAATGKELEDVTLALLSGIAGNTQATLALGIDLRDTALAHSELGKEANKAFNDMSDLEKQQLRLGVLFERSAPLMGAAANALTTISGASDKLAVTLDAVQAKLGQQGTITRSLIILQQRLLETFLSLPEPILVVVGSIQDFAGVFLTITGTILKYILIVTTLVTVLGLLRTAIASSAIAQTALNWAFSFAPASIAATIVPVTGLSAAYANLIVVTRALSAALLANLVAALKVVMLAIGKFLIVLAPIAFKIALIGAVVAAFGKALMELVDEIPFLKNGVAQLAEVFTGTGKKVAGLSANFELLKKGLIGIFNIVKEVSKLLLSGLITSVLLAARAFIYLRMQFSSSTEKAKELENQLATIDTNILQMSRTVEKSLANLSDPFVETAEAAENLAKKTKHASDELDKFKSSMDALKEFTDLGQDLKLEALGDEFDRAKLASQQANIEFNKSFDRLNNAAEKSKDLVEESGKLYISNAKAFLVVEKLKLDTIKNLRKTEQQTILDTLKTQGQLAEAAKIEAAERMKDFELQVAGLRKIGGLNAQRLIEIDRIRNALKAQGQAQVDAAKEEEVKRAIEEQKKATRELEQAQDRAIKKLEDMQKQAIDLNFELLKRGETERKILDLEAEKQLLIAKNLEDELRGVGKLDGASQAIIDQFKSATIAKRNFAKEDLGVGAISLGEMVDGFKALSSAAENFKMPTFAGVKEGLTQAYDDAGEYLAKKIKSITLKDIGEALVGTVEFAATALKGIFSGGYINDLSGIVEEFGNIPENLLKAFENFAGVVDRLVQSLPTIIERFLAALPVLIERLVAAFPKLIDMLVAALPRIAQALADAAPKILQAILDALPKLIAVIPQIIAAFIRAIPGMISQIMAALPQIITEIFNAIPQVVIELIKALPAVIENLVENIDKVVLAFVEGFIGAVGEIVAALIDELLLGGGLERIIGALLRAIPRIALALVQGIVRGLVKFFNSIGNIFKGKIKAPKEITDLPQTIDKGLKTIGEKVAKETAQIFSIKDLQKGLQQVDLAEKVANAFRTGVSEADKKVRTWGQKIWDNFIKPVLDWFGDRGTEIWNGFIKPILTWFGDRGTEIWNGFIKPILTWFGDRGTEIWDGFLKPVLTWFADRGKEIWEGFIFPILNAFYEFGKEIWEGFLFPILDAFYEFGKAIWDGFIRPIGEFFIKLGAQIWEGFLRPIGEAFIGFGKAIWDNFIKPVGNWFGDMGTAIWNGLVKIASSAWEFLEGLGKSIWQGLVNLVTTAGDLFSNLGTMIWNGFKGLVEAAGDLFGGIGAKIWNGLKAALEGGFEFIKKLGTKIWDGLSDAVKNPGELFSGLGGKIWTGFKNGLEGTKNFFSDIGGKIWSGLKSGLDGLSKFFKDLFDKLNPANLFEKIFKVDYKGKGTVENALGIDIPFLNFAGGGLVPGNAMVPGDSFLNDRILALLSPGEAIVPRSIMDNPAIGNLIRAVIDGKVTPPKFGYGSQLVKKAKATGGNVSEGAKDLGGQASDIAKEGGAIISDAGKDAGAVLSKAYHDSGVADTLGNLDPTKAWEKVRGAVMDMIMKMFQANKFHSGGMIQAYANGGEVPVLAQAGEFIVNRRATAGNLGLLNSINSGGSYMGQGGGGNVIIEKIEINAKTFLDAEQIRREVIPAIEKDLRRKSQDGQRILDPAGVRK